MRRMQAIAVCALALAVAVSAQADLAGPEPRAGQSCTVLTAPLASPSGQEGLALARVGIGGGLPGGDRPAANSAGREVHVLPGAPSSLALFLSAMGGLGLWQMGRSARKIHLANVPEWFHTGGPVRIGHSTPVEPDLAANLPACRFDQPAGEHCLLCFNDPERDALVRSQTHLGIEPARGPPLFSL